MRWDYSPIPSTPPSFTPARTPRPNSTDAISPAAYRVRKVLATLLVYGLLHLAWRYRWSNLFLIILILLIIPDTNRVVKQIQKSVIGGLKTLYESETLLRLSVFLLCLAQEVSQHSLYDHIESTFDFFHFVGLYILEWLPVEHVTDQVPSAYRVTSVAEYERIHGPLSKPDWINETEESEFLEYLRKNHPNIRFECPITKEVLVNPVVASDGFTYEATSILEWYRRNLPRPLSPLTGKELENMKLVPNKTLKAIIESQKCQFRESRRKASSHGPLSWLNRGWSGSSQK